MTGPAATAPAAAPYEGTSEWEQGTVQIVDQCQSCGRGMRAGAQIMQRRVLPLGYQRVCLRCHREPLLGLEEPVQA